MERLTFDDRFGMVPMVDEESRLLSFDERKHLHRFLAEIESGEQEDINRECWAELRRYRAIHGTPPIEKRPQLRPATED